jgi:hypothetical protein
MFFHQIQDFSDHTYPFRVRVDIDVFAHLSCFDLSLMVRRFGFWLVEKRFVQAGNGKV